MSNMRHLSDLLESFTQSGPPGCALGIAQKGKIIYESYHGMADVDAQRPMDEGAVFRLFSMTKVIVCAAALILFERGKFLLSDPLSDYLPEYGEPRRVKVQPNGSLQIVPAARPLRVRDAFTMACGLPYANGDSYTAREIRKVQEELRETLGAYDLRTEIRAMADVPLAFEPGTRWLYGYGHDLVAGLIEVTSGMRVGEFLRREIFEPLGMTSTGYRYFGDIEQRMVTLARRNADGGVTRLDGMFDARHQPDAIYEGGGSGLFSTVRDYLRFTQMLANGGTLDGARVLGRKTIDLMRRNHLSPEQMADFNNVYLAGYGYGLGVRTLVDAAAGGSNGSFGAFGWTGAAGTWTEIDPSEGLSIVYMHQTMPNMEEYHHLRVRAAAYGCL